MSAPNTGGVSVFVDYAHTPDALEKRSRPSWRSRPGRTVCVFGCGGDRDASKRPIMGKAPWRRPCGGASDNPRTEDPQAIIEDIVSGMSSGAGRFEVEADRRAAIARAIAQNARTIIMDEPTSALDYGNTVRVLSTVRQLAREGMSIVQSTHQPIRRFFTPTKRSSSTTDACTPSETPKTLSPRSWSAPSTTWTWRSIPYTATRCACACPYAR